jgi:hypothetical protein
VNYARRQQYRRVSRAGTAALASAVAALLGLVGASAGAAAPAGLLLLTAVGLGLCARRWLGLAGRSRVGARSEDEVQRTLAPLRAEGWQLRHSLPWQGQGDIDSVAIAPTGIAVVIETKGRSGGLDRSLDACASPRGGDRSRRALDRIGFRSQVGGRGR